MEELGKFHHAYWLPGLGEETSESGTNEGSRKFGIYFTPDLARKENEKYRMHPDI